MSGFEDAGNKPLPHFLGHRERLKERFRESGHEAMPDYELLEMVLFRAFQRGDTKDLAKRLRAGEIAVIDHTDIDRVAAESLIAAGVAAVVNAGTSISGRYPNFGPIRLLRAGVPIVDGVDRSVMLGIWGIESAYGDQDVQQNHMRPIFPALAALAWGEPRRRKYWEQEPYYYKCLSDREQHHQHKVRTLS